MYAKHLGTAAYYGSVLCLASLLAMPPLQQSTQLARKVSSNSHARIREVLVAESGAWKLHRAAGRCSRGACCAGTACGVHRCFLLRESCDQSAQQRGCHVRCRVGVHSEWNCEAVCMCVCGHAPCLSIVVSASTKLLMSVDARLMVEVIV